MAEIKTVVSDLLVARPFDSAEDAIDSILECLKQQIPFKLWMVTRVDDNDWTVIRCLDETYGIVPGKIFAWSDSYCARMVRGEGPLFAEDVQHINTYRQAPINQVLPIPIGAYIGLPILMQDGHLAGTLCAMDPSPQLPLSEQQKSLVLTLTRALNTLQIIFAEAENSRRKAEKYRYEAETDALTSVYNRRGWELALLDQEQATARTAQNAMIAIIDLDDLKAINDSQGHSAGDALLVAAAQILTREVRDEDVIARLGGDEFAVLVAGISGTSASTLSERLQQALAQANIKASIGYALRLAHKTMTETVRAADMAMYRNKQERQISNRTRLKPFSIAG
jgi:diguanylate cyclase